QGTAGRLRPNTSSQMIGCLFKLEICVDRGVYALSRVKSSQICDHNHELDAAPLLQVRNKRLQQSEEKIPSLWNSGIPPLQILKNLRYDDAQAAEGITRNDIYNLIRRHRQRELNGRTEISRMTPVRALKVAPLPRRALLRAMKPGMKRRLGLTKRCAVKMLQVGFIATQIPPDYEGDIDEYITKGLEEQRALLEASQDIMQSLSDVE
ncbi:hypothetical protein E4U52_000851, partial [Claviceps spartinae]